MVTIRRFGTRKTELRFKPDQSGTVLTISVRHGPMSSMIADAMERKQAFEIDGNYFKATQATVNMTDGHTTYTLQCVKPPAWATS
jgi:hypothetical protein